MLENYAKQKKENKQLIKRSKTSRKTNMQTFDFLQSGFNDFD